MPSPPAGEGQGEGVITYYLYSDEGLIGEYDSTGTEIKTYGYKSNSTWTTDPLFMKQGRDYYFYHNDHLGTSMKTTNTSGAVVWSATYDAFGKATVDASATVTNNLRGFPGQYFDTETGLHYNGNRYYDSEMGRYLAGDPLGLYGGINLYAYARINPLSYIDPIGLKERETDIYKIQWGGDGRSNPWDGPRYGNWGGGCNPQKRGVDDCGKAPIDSSDECYMNYDKFYDKAKKDKCIKEEDCDKDLVACLKKLYADPAKWPKPPPPPETRDSAKRFRNWAIPHFSPMPTNNSQ